MYFRTGVAASPDGIEAAGLSNLGRAPSFPEVRDALRRRLSQRIASRDQVLALLGGGLNFVANVCDRRCAATAAVAGGRDRGEETSWHRHLGLPHGLHELRQPDMACAFPAPRSRLDRICCNQAVGEGFDRKVSCAALEWQPEPSRRRAVSFRRSLPQRGPDACAPIPDRILDRPEWPRKVSLAWQVMLDSEPSAPPPRRLVLLKRAMRQAAKNFGFEASGPTGLLSHEDRLRVTMQFLRASEKGSAGGVSQCVQRCPVLKDLVDNPCDFHASPGRRLRLVRARAADVTRDRAMDELG